MSAQAPVSREEWELRILSLESTTDDLARASEQEGPGYSDRVAIKHGRNFAARLKLLDSIMALQAEVERLRVALEKYGRHDRQCQWHTSAMPICPCGFSDIEKARQPK